MSCTVCNENDHNKRYHSEEELRKWRAIKIMSKRRLVAEVYLLRKEILSLKESLNKDRQIEWLIKQNNELKNELSYHCDISHWDE